VSHHFSTMVMSLFLQVNENGKMHVIGDIVIAEWRQDLDAEYASIGFHGSNDEHDISGYSQQRGT